VALLFLFLGKGTFAAIGITVGDFQVAGGLILFVLASRELFHSAAAAPAKLSEDFGVVPLGMPLIAGPAVITTLLLMTEAVGIIPTLSALAVNLGLVALAFAYAENLAKLIGPTGLRAISKIIGLLLAAIAVSMVRKGLVG
jgi:multiple antibiotic resistance protein